ncbi:MAG: response regulator [Magnetococcales bacterium]|nr:response regulator [Magnetococcales bacterium]
MARILLIDDDQDIIDSLTLVLAGNGHAVTVRMDTADLVAGVRQTDPDLVILDIMFPEDAQAGFKAARLLSQHPATREIPILVLSAVNQRSNLSFGFSEADISADFMPVQAFLEKPVEPRILLERIDRLLRQAQH